MKIDAFTHIFRRGIGSGCCAPPDGRDMHKRVRAIPSIVELDARFRIMDGFGDDYRQVLTIGSPPIEVFNCPVERESRTTGMAELVRATRSALRASPPRCR